MSLSCFVEDGQSRDGYLPESPRIHGALRFRYRPALAEERFQFLKAKDYSGEDEVKRIAKLINSHLESWDAPLEKNEANIRKLHPNLLTRLLDVVMGYTAPEEANDAKN